MYKIAITLTILLNSTAGFSATLQAIDLDDDTTTIEAYYHPDADVTWLADTNLGLTETFGLERGPITDYGSTIESTGAMLTDALEAYIAGMNQNVYLGYSEWRLPISPTFGDLTCSSQVGEEPYIVTWGTGCEAPETGAMNELIFSEYGSADESPFTSIDTIRRWLGSFGPAGGHHYFTFGDERNDAKLEFCGSGRCGAGYVWPVHSGKIGVAILECIDTDGDGWGWNGVESCIPVDQECIDTDGDGWGWTGTESCRTDEPIVAGECIDNDGDGWGWDGVQSCLINE